ncbi:hypothetical protein PG993_013261 [Apiospora rasikravindrae]|uniref:Uncharacterized protein n=1 Tax=Apiospora rasikravindrae TaxID=990691 RepID=A0ABR1RX65_9PEZI
MARERNSHTSKEELEGRFAKLTLGARKRKDHFKPTKTNLSRGVTEQRLIYYIGNTQAVLQLTEQNLPEIRLEGDSNTIIWESDIEAMLEHALDNLY